MRFKIRFLLLAGGLLIAPLLFLAQGSGDEEFNVTTYYLSPNATYFELRAKQLGVGATYYNTSAAHVPVIPDGTSLIVEKNMGINTVNPATKLHVSGYVKLDSLGGSAGLPVSPNFPLVCWKGSGSNLILGKCTGNVQTDGSCDCP